MSQYEDRHSREDPVDLELARAIRRLDKEIQPSRNLWPGIERRIAEYPQRPAWRTNQLMPYGVAASLVIAVVALIFSLNNSLKDDVSNNTIAAPSLDTLQAEYLRVRNPMLETFNQTNSSLDPQTLEDLYRNIAIMEEARHQIETLIRENPENRHLVGMLMRVHQQELELLRQDYTRAQRSL